MSNTSGVQRSGGPVNPFDERFDNLRGYAHPPSSHRANSMDSATPYQPVPPGAATIQQVRPQLETRRGMLPTSVVAAFAASSPIQRLPSHPTLPEQNLRTHNDGIVPGPPGHSFIPYKTSPDHQNRPPEQTYRDGPQLNFKYDNSTQDPNHPRAQQPHGRPYPVPHQQQAHQEQPQQNQPTITSAPQRPPPPSAPSPIALQPPPVPLRKPNPSQAPPIHPDAAKVAAKALTPIQHLYEDAWARTVASVQHEISRMHAELTRLLDAERRQSQMLRVERDAVFEEANRLRAENAELREDVKRAAAEVQRVRLDRDDQAFEFRRLQANNEVLHRQGQAQIQRVQAGEQAQKDAMHSTVESIRADMDKQFEVERAVKLRELQEQKALRALAEKRLAETTKRLKGITDGLLSASQFCSEQDRQSSESATLIGTPEMELSKFKDEREDDPSRERSPIARGERVLGSHPPSRSTSVSPLAQTSPPHVKQEPVPARQQATPPSHSPCILPRIQSPQPLASSSRSPPLPHPRASDIPHDHRGSHDRSPALRPIVISDDLLRHKGPDERLASSTAPRTNRSHPATPVHSVPPSPALSKRQPQPDKAGRQRSPSPRARSTSRQTTQPPSPRHPFTPSPAYYNPPPALAGPSSHQHYRQPTNHAPFSPLRSPITMSPAAPRFATPLSPPQGAPDQRKRKRGRTEFEREGSGRWPQPPLRSNTDPSDDRERARPRPRLEEPRIGAQAERRADVAPVPRVQPAASSSSSASTGSLEEGELKVDTGQSAAPVGVDVKPHIEKARARPNKIGINHMDLLYETVGDKMICRMCRSRPKDATEKLSPPVTFPANASWPELVGHCKTGHPKDWGDLERLSPGHIGELRQRMVRSSSSGFMLK